MLGPIDYMTVGFEGNRFDGSILSELSKAIESNTIRVIDLVFVVKDADGNVTAAELEGQPGELQELVNSFGLDEGMPLLTEGDVEKIGASMGNNTAAGTLVIEHLWAKGLKKALLDAGGIVVAEGRIRPDSVSAAVEELSQVKA